MHHTRAILRRAAAQKGMQGDAAARDKAIKVFTEELGLLFTPRMIAAIEDDTLALIFEDWVRSFSYLDEEQRVEAIIQDVRLCSVPYLVYRKGFHQPKQVDKPPVNVVSLYTR